MGGGTWEVRNRIDLSGTEPSCRQRPGGQDKVSVATPGRAQTEAHSLAEASSRAGQIRAHTGNDPKLYLCHAGPACMGVGRSGPASREVPRGRAVDLE